MFESCWALLLRWVGGTFGPASTSRECRAGGSECSLGGCSRQGGRDFVEVAEGDWRGALLLDQVIPQGGCILG